MFTSTVPLRAVFVRQINSKNGKPLVFEGRRGFSVTPFLLSEVLHRDASNAVILDVDMLRAHIVALDGAST